VARYKYRTPDNEDSVNVTTNVEIGSNSLKGKEVFAVDYNQTIANIIWQRKIYTTVTNKIKPPTFPDSLPDEVEAGDYIKKDQIQNLQNATRGLVKYSWGDQFRYTTFSEKIKSIHLEEARQVVDDSLNHARCVGGCSSECGRACGEWCTTECFGNCGGDCDGGCTDSCHGGCSDACASTVCSNSCKTDCAKSCTSACSSACTSCSSSCSGGCSNTCTGSCARSCTGTCANTATGG
jgi:hypothetical protein